MRIVPTGYGARVVDGDAMLSKVLVEPGPTHSVLDVLAACVVTFTPGPSVALLGFAAGGMIAPLRAMGFESDLDAVDLWREGERCFRRLCGEWSGGVRFHCTDAAAWLRRGHRKYDLIVDDLSDFRPGHRAAKEAGVRAPLAEAGLGKDDIRARSRELGLPTWDRPSSPCLSSRLPYGTPVTPEALRRIDRAEAGLHALGFRELRVRHLGDAARVEIAREEMARLAAPGAREAAEAAVRAAGYTEVQIDPEGYRRGRLNEALRVVEVVGGGPTGI